MAVDPVCSLSRTTLGGLNVNSTLRLTQPLAVTDLTRRQQMGTSIRMNSLIIYRKQIEGDAHVHPS